MTGEKVFNTGKSEQESLIDDIDQYTDLRIAISECESISDSYPLS